MDKSITIYDNIASNYRALFMCWGISGAILGQQNQKPITKRVTGYIVETAGFEPASRGPDTHLSTCVVY